MQQYNEIISTERILTVKEVSVMLNIKVGTLYRLARENRIPTISIGKIKRFSEADVLAWIEKRKNSVA